MTDPADHATSRDHAKDVAEAHQAQVLNRWAIGLFAVAALVLVVTIGWSDSQGIRFAVGAAAMLAALFLGLSTAWVLALAAERKRNRRRDPDRDSR